MRNLLCDQPHCGNPAYVFGFVRGTEKTKACRCHTLDLTDKQITVFDIAGHDFILSPQDWPLYVQRKNLLHTGLDCLTMLETRCQGNLEECERSIQAVREQLIEPIERVCQEMRFKVHQRHDEVMRDLSEKRNQLERLVTERDFKLSTEELMLCEAVPEGALFSLVVGDCQLGNVEMHLVPIERFMHQSIERRSVNSAACEPEIAAEIKVPANELQQPVKCQYCQEKVCGRPVLCYCEKVLSN